MCWGSGNGAWILVFGIYDFVISLDVDIGCV